MLLLQTIKFADFYTKKQVFVCRRVGLLKKHGTSFEIFWQMKCVVLRILILAVSSIWVWECKE
jgi:hypothetical protein